MQYNGDLDFVNIDPKWLYFLYVSEISLNVNKSAQVLFKVKFTHICILREMRLETTRITFPRNVYERPQPWSCAICISTVLLGPVSSHRPAADRS